MSAGFSKRIISNSQNLYVMRLRKDNWWNRTRKSKKFAEHKKIKRQFQADSDELQLLDECNTEWAEAWKDAAKQETELEVHVLRQEIEETKLVGTYTKKKR